MVVAEQIKLPPRSQVEIPVSPVLNFGTAQTKVLEVTYLDSFDCPAREVQNIRGAVGRFAVDELKQLLEHLSPHSQQLLLIMARDLAASEGISLSSGHLPTFTDLPAAIPLWEDDLSSRGYSDRTIETYSYWVKRVLDTVPEPTYLGLTHYLAEERKREIETSQGRQDRAHLPRERGS